MSGFSGYHWSLDRDCFCASDRESLNVVRHQPSNEYTADLVRWYFLGPIVERQMDIWSLLLQASYGWKELYKTIGQSLDMYLTVCTF
jgi:hypothetical protein